MPDDQSSSGGGRIWQGLRGLLFGDRDASLRNQIEEAIDDHEEDGDVGAKGDLSSVERQMLRNLLHFGERTAGDAIVSLGVGQHRDGCDLSGRACSVRVAGPRGA